MDEIELVFSDDEFLPNKKAAIEQAEARMREGHCVIGIFLSQTRNWVVRHTTRTAYIEYMKAKGALTIVRGRKYQKV